VHPARSESESLETLDIDKRSTRGWTLPEMTFYGPIRHLLRRIKTTRMTRHSFLLFPELLKIPSNNLYNFRRRLHRAWEKMTWAAGRKTTRIEDAAYSVESFGITMTNIDYSKRGGRSNVQKIHDRGKVRMVLTSQSQNAVRKLNFSWFLFPFFLFQPANRPEASTLEKLHSCAISLHSTGIFHALGDQDL
jgi:hypothetical protein